MSETLKGVLLAGAAAVFWGLMGVSAQFIMGTSGFTPGDLVSLRLMGSGVVLLGAMGLLAHRNIFRPIASKENFLAVLLYGAGVVAAQYFFFVAIEHTNAGTAAILVTTIPLMIIAWLFFAEHRPVSKKEMLCALLAVSGVVALITRGDFSGLHFSVMGLAAGLLSAAASAFYTLQPKKAIARIGVGPVISWGFFLGGLVMCFCYPPWESTAEWSWQAGAAYAYIDQSQRHEEGVQSMYALEYLRHKVVASIGLDLLPNLALDVNYRFQERRGSYTGTDGINRAYKPYQLVDARLAWSKPRYSVYVEANNLFGAHYVDYGNVPQPGLWVMAGARFTFSL